jgi:hypothetical protein
MDTQNNNNTLNLFPSFKAEPYKDRIAIWDSVLKKILNNSNIKYITWGSKDITESRIGCFTREAILNAYKNKKYIKKQTSNGASWYEIKFIDLQVKTTITKKQKSKTKYEIYENNKKKFKIISFKDGKPKTIIKKDFDSRKKAISYIRGPLRRPKFQAADHI